MQTFSKGYAVLWQVAHLSWVPENMEETLLAGLACEHHDRKRFNFIISEGTKKGLEEKQG